MEYPQHRYIIRVSGLVQGVFFRDSTRAEAQKFGLTGYARNEPDGSVTIEVEGATDALESFVAWCQNGPPAARVDTCTCDRTDALVNYTKFEIC